MKCNLDKYGAMTITAETELESFGLFSFIERSMSRCEFVDADRILAGYFLIRNIDGECIMDEILDAKEVVAKEALKHWQETREEATKQPLEV